MKAQQELIIQRQLEAGQLEVVIPYDDDTLNKLFVLTLIPEIALIGAELSPSRRARTEVILTALRQLIFGQSAVVLSPNGFPVSSRLSNAGLRSQLNSLAIVFDYIETDKLAGGEGSWQDLLEEEGRRNAIKQNVDDITRQISDFNFNNFGIDELIDEFDADNVKQVKAQAQGLALYPLVDKKNEPFFILSLLSEYDVEGEFDEEGLPSQSISGGRSAQLTQIYMDTTEFVEIDGEKFYSTFAWVDDDWEVIGQISEYDERVVDGKTIFQVSKKQAADEVKETVVGRMLFTEPIENASEIRKAIGKNPAIGKVYSAKSGVLFTAKSVAGRLLWVDTAILVGSGVLSLFIPQVKPFSPIGEALEGLFKFAGKALDLNADELVPELDKINLDAGIFAIATQLFALDEISATFTPTAESVQRDLNLDKRTFGIALANAGVGGVFNSFKQYDSWKILTVLSITIIVIGVLRQVPAFFRR